MFRVVCRLHGNHPETGCREMTDEIAGGLSAARKPSRLLAAPPPDADGPFAESVAA